MANENRSTHLNTMGTASCATFSIAGFGQKAINDNKKYLESNLTTKNKIKKECLKSSQDFMSRILLSLKQPLGTSKDFPFQCWMEVLNLNLFCNKFIIITLNATQHFVEDNYWPKELNKHGFELIDKTKNAHGQICFIYTRNINRKPIHEGEF